MNKTRVQYTVLFLLLTVVSVFSIKMFFSQRTAGDLLDIQTFPHTVGTWMGKDVALEEYEYKLLETRNILLRDYTDPAGEMITLFIVYSETNRSVFHPPEVCLIGSGITISDKQIDTVNIGSKEFSTNELYLQKNDDKQIDLYSYKIGDLYTDKYYLQQALFAVNQLLGRRKGGATIRVSMLVNKDAAHTLRSLKAFMSEVVLQMDKL